MNVELNRVDVPRFDGRWRQQWEAQAGGKIITANEASFGRDKGNPPSEAILNAALAVICTRVEGEYNASVAEKVFIVKYYAYLDEQGLQDKDALVKRCVDKNIPTDELEEPPL